MKKFLKSLAKKSMSLFLAVLMLMSCWVWVAPEKAEAASADEGYYQVRIFVPTFEDPDQREHFVYDRLKIICADGSEQEITHNGGHVAATTNYVIAEGWVNSFPKGVRHEWQQKQYQETDGCGNTSNKYENGYYLKTPRAEFYDNVNKKWIKFAERTDNYATDGSGAEKSVTYTAVEVEAPKAQDSKISGDTAFELDIPLIGSVTTDSHTAPTISTKDQYGVSIGAPKRYFVSTSSDGSVRCVEDKESDSYYGIWYKDGVVTANADVQIKHPIVSGETNKAYLIADYETNLISIAEITLKYPSYTLKVDPDGSISGLGATMDMSDNSTQTGSWSDNGPYSYTATKYPNGTATKTGYTFKYFWTVKQPTDGDAGIDASEATFAEPVDQATFDTYKAQEGATVDGRYVTLSDGKKYFNAGTQWDPATHKEILGDNTFYGWWIPKDIVVKFYDVDGSFLGTQIAKYGSKPAENWYPDPKDGYNAGAYDYQGFAKQWRDITGAVITEGTYTFGALETLSLTPIYTNKEYKDKHQVNFVNPADGNNISGNSKEYEYRYILKDTDIPTVAVPAVLVNDPGYSYEFTGWTSQKPASGYYHKVAKDDTAITENADWVVREEIKYYPIFRSTVKEYLVNFNYTDSTGAAKTESLVVPYGSAISTPNVVNRTYATGGYGYTLEGWDYQNNLAATVMLGADATVVFDNTKVFITTNNLAPNGTPIVFTANYDEGQPTPYTVTFKYKDAEGKDKVITGEVYHGYAITQEIVDKISVPAQYDDGKALYTFSNLWKVTEGSADKAEYEKDEFTSFSPVSHVTFEALYGEGVPFYTVTYIDGAAKYSERVLAGKNVPAWTVTVDGAEKEYVPTKAKTETGEYTFEGWFDAEQTDKDFAQTNGTEYTTSSIVNSDLVLYPQFKFEPFKFTIKFVNFDGAVLAEGEFEAGESFEDMYEEAEAKAIRGADATYSYTFIGWDYDPGNLICAGKDMTYTAQYRPSYIYYKARWYNDFDSMKNADPEMEVVGQDGLLAITSHTYKGSVYAPSVELDSPDSNNVGETMAFEGWYYLKDGVETAYQRGMTITNGMSFYAKYKAVKNALTVTTIVNGESTNYTVEYDSKITGIGNPVDGYVNATTHNKFVGWYADEACETEFDFNTAITENTTIYAKFTEAAHNKDQKELIAAPTYYAKGSEIIWCACSKEDTDETVEIPMLTDTVAPTGTIYLGTQGKWSSTDEEGAAATDGNEVIYFANADTDIILTINDTGDVNNAYNPGGVGKGIKIIRGIISTGIFGEGTTEAQMVGIQTIFSDESEKLNNTANYVIRLGTYEGLVDGETYIVYYYAADKAGNALNKNVRTARFIYDITAPELTITGDSNVATAGEYTVTYCAKATVTGIEEGATLTVNGKDVEYAGSEYVITKAGNYIITVTDKAGNSTSKKIIVTDGHDEVTTSMAVTCTENGYEKVTCAVCAKVIKNVTIESEGHKYGEATTVAPTCTDKGYDVKVCSVCGHEDKTNEKPIAGHNHEKDADGNIVYTVVTPATCQTEGKKISNCTVCGKDTMTETIPADTVNGHKYGAVKVLKATCTSDGEEYQNCKYCFAKKTVKVLDKLNHNNTGRYTKVTTAATCYSEGVATTYCKGCDAVMETAPVAMIGHTLVLVKYEGEANDDAANYENGYMQYECKATGCTHTEGKTAIAVKKSYTVTFKGAGVNGADVIITKTEGESIELNAVADQIKAKDNEYEYTFAGWRSSSGKLVKLPVKVTKNETYTAEFTATDRVYTHTFVGEDGIITNPYAVIVGKYEDTNKKPAAVPSKAATPAAKYEFRGWVRVGDDTNTPVTDFTMTEDATFKATFNTIPVAYNVIYIYGTTILYSESVKGGLTVPAYNGSWDKVVKAYDSNYHYEFDKWSIDTETEVLADTYIQPVFKPVKHIYDAGVQTTDPTCTKTGVKTFTCECGRTYTDSVAATGDHEMVDGVCKHCGYADTVANVTITFKNDKGTIYAESVAPGTSVTYTAIPTKDSTAQYNYTFIGWKVSGAEDSTASKQTVFEVNSDMVYIAVFEETVRTYTVTYFNGGKPIKKFTDVEYGAYIPVYTDATPTKDFNSKEHYNFLGWSINNGPTYTIDKVITEIVTSDTAVYAKYQTVPHILGAPVAGTCSKPAYQLCTECEYEYVIPGATDVAHTPDEETIVEIDSTFDTTGTKTYFCTSCKQTITETTPVKEHILINIMVYTDDGAPADYVNVKLLHNGVVYEMYEEGKDTYDGFVSFKVDKTLDKKLWSAYIVGDGIAGGISGAVKTTIPEIGYINEFNKPESDDEGTGTPEAPKPEEPEKPDCSCSCHKNTFWGIIFRFFQKIIKFFGGKDCCVDPRR